MTESGVTDALIYELVTSTHAEGIVDLDVAAAIEHRGQVLLVASGGDELDPVFDVPGTAVLPGEHLLDALCRCLAALGLRVAEFTGYLGHHDCHQPHRLVRVCFFAVRVTDPHAICHFPTVGHEWADLDEPEAFPVSARPYLTELSTWPRLSRPHNQDPELAGPLRSCARGLYPVEAGVELLIGHDAWLHRSDFTERFVHIATDTQMAIIDWVGAITALDNAGLPCSSGEEKMLRLSASLADTTPTNLGDALTGLDSRNAHLVSQAVLHACGFPPVTDRCGHSS